MQLLCKELLDEYGKYVSLSWLIADSLVLDLDCCGNMQIFDGVRQIYIKYQILSWKWSSCGFEQYCSSYLKVYCDWLTECEGLREFETNNIVHMVSRSFRFVHNFPACGESAKLSK